MGAKSPSAEPTTLDYFIDRRLVERVLDNTTIFSGKSARILNEIDSRLTAKPQSEFGIFLSRWFDFRFSVDDESLSQAYELKSEEQFEETLKLAELHFEIQKALSNNMSHQMTHTLRKPINVSNEQSTLTVDLLRQIFVAEYAVLMYELLSNSFTEAEPNSNMEIKQPNSKSNWQPSQVSTTEVNKSIKEERKSKVSKAEKHRVAIEFHEEIGGLILQMLSYRAFNRKEQLCLTYQVVCASRQNFELGAGSLRALKNWCKPWCLKNRYRVAIKQEEFETIQSLAKVYLDQLYLQTARENDNPVLPSFSDDTLVIRAFPVSRAKQKTKTS